MNIQEYIESGKLELFLLGELNEREREEVLSLAKDYPEIRQELDALEEAMFAFDQKTGQAPRKEVKNKIFDTLDKEFAKEAPSVKTEAPVTPIKSLSPWRTFAVAASLVAVLTTSAAIYFASKFYDTEEKFTALLQEQEVMADLFNQTKQESEVTESRLDRLVAGDFKRVEMKGESLPMQKDAKVDVFWDQKAQEVFVAVNNLNQLTQDLDYQLWAIGKEGPVGIGLVNPGEKFTLQQMQAVAEAGAFAITIEPKGGSQSPTLDKLVVLGEVS